MCQRYYEKNSVFGGHSILINSSFVPYTVRNFFYAVDKRISVTPTVVVTNQDNAAAGNGTIYGSTVRGFNHGQGVANAGFPYCSISLVYEANAEL